MQQNHKEVFGSFKGMDDEYKKIVSTYTTAKFIEVGKYSKDYLEQLRQETEANVHKLMNERHEKALERLQAIDDDCTPQPDVKPMPKTVEEQILMQLERNNNLLQVKARIESSQDKKEAYKEIFKEFKDDDFILKYLDNLSYELKDYDKEMVRYEIESETSNPFSKEIDKVKAVLNTALSESATMYPEHLETGFYRDLGSIMSFRAIRNDLDIKESLKEGWDNASITPANY